jgi:hypothetical protein
MKNGLRQAQAPEQPFFVRTRKKTMRFLSPSPTGTVIFFSMSRRKELSIISPSDRRGAETDERSESDEVGWWKKFREKYFSWGEDLSEYLELVS